MSPFCVKLHCSRPATCEVWFDGSPGHACYFHLGDLVKLLVDGAPVGEFIKLEVRLLEEVNSEPA